MRLGIGSALASSPDRLLGQGVSTHTAKPLPRAAPSGRPFHAYFVDVATQAGQTVVQDGPYRFIRHPAYSGTLLALLGIGLTLGNWLALLVVLGGGVAGHLYRAHVEEQALVAALGEPYRAYMRRTRRFIPFVW